MLGNDTLLLCLCAAFPFALPSLIRSHIAFTAVLHLAQQDSQIEKGRYAVRLDNLLSGEMYFFSNVPLKLYYMHN